MEWWKTSTSSPLGAAQQWRWSANSTTEILMFPSMVWCNSSSNTCCFSCTADTRLFQSAARELWTSQVLTSLRSQAFWHFHLHRIVLLPSSIGYPLGILRQCSPQCPWFLHVPSLPSDATYGNPRLALIPTVGLDPLSPPQQLAHVCPKTQHAPLQAQRGLDFHWGRLSE